MNMKIKIFYVVGLLGVLTTQIEAEKSNRLPSSVVSSKPSKDPLQHMLSIHLDALLQKNTRAISTMVKSYMPTEKMISEILGAVSAGVKPSDASTATQSIGMQTQDYISPKDQTSNKNAPLVPADSSLGKYMTRGGTVMRVNNGAKSESAAKNLVEDNIVHKEGEILNPAALGQPGQPENPPSGIATITHTDTSRSAEKIPENHESESLT